MKFSMGQIFFRKPNHTTKTLSSSAVKRDHMNIYCMLQASTREKPLAENQKKRKWKPAAEPKKWS